MNLQKETNINLQHTSDSILLISIFIFYLFQLYLFLDLHHFLCYCLSSLVILAIHDPELSLFGTTAFFYTHTTLLYCFILLSMHIIFAIFFYVNLLFQNCWFSEYSCGFYLKSLYLTINCEFFFFKKNNLVIKYISHLVGFLSEFFTSRKYKNRFLSDLCMDLQTVHNCYSIELGSCFRRREE